MNTAIVNKAYRFTKWLYREFLPSGYRDFELDQAMDLKNNCVRAGLKRKFSDAELEVMALASLLHNTGCVEGQYTDKHASVVIAANFLKEHGYPPKRIKSVLHCIEATAEDARAINRSAKLMQRIKFRIQAIQGKNAEGCPEVGDLWP